MEDKNAATRKPRKNIVEIFKKLLPITQRDWEILFLISLVSVAIALPYNLPLNIQDIYWLFGFIALSSIVVISHMLIIFLNMLAIKLEQVG